MADAASVEADLQGQLSPPRDNGELIFAAPWERRVFGLTVALCSSERCAWESFRRRLIAQIAQQETRPYWQSWAAALEDLLADTNVLTQSELDARRQAFLLRPAGHDHRH